jgi:nitrogen fixation/metabolism regulation signal transduction histidine kinase
MAGQIAHEIKNPPPMKLNAQLFKWWKDKAPDFGGKLRTFTGNQIEYIDNLSNIATAFSYFARLPDAEPAEVNVFSQLKTTLEMFGNAENVSVTLDSGNISKAVVMADKEHLNGIFSNILKNALQAIPSGRKGIINVKLCNPDKVRSGSLIMERYPYELKPECLPLTHYQIVRYGTWSPLQTLYRDGRRDNLV